MGVERCFQYDKDSKMKANHNKSPDSVRFVVICNNSNVLWLLRLLQITVTQKLKCRCDVFMLSHWHSACQLTHSSSVSMSARHGVAISPSPRACPAPRDR